MQIVRGTKREARAMKSKSSFGLKLDESIWHSREVIMLNKLAESGADVPKVIFTAENSFAMEFIGDENGAAKRLIDIQNSILNPNELFEQIMKNISIFLENDIVHGDLSAYNILCDSNGKIKIIDFPQAVEIMKNVQAKMLFERDLHNICKFFKKLSVPCDEKSLAEQLWNSEWRSYVNR
jgi:RIO kinase 1